MVSNILRSHTVIKDDDHGSLPLVVYFGWIPNIFEEFQLGFPAARLQTCQNQPGHMSQVGSMRALVNLLLAVTADKNAKKDYGHWAIDLEP